MLKYKEYIALLNSQLKEELTSSQKKEVDKWEQGDNSFTDKIFGDKHNKRLYIDVNHHENKSHTQLDIEDFLKHKGIEIIDYKKGIGEDKFKRNVKIGKALEKNNAPLELKQKYVNDPIRQAYKHSDLHVCISRHQYDVAGMTSSNQPWNSCMNFENGINNEYLPFDVKHGTHVAYLTDKGDKENARPLARIALKKFSNIENQHDHILRPEVRTYGNASNSFAVTVNDWVENNLPADKNSIYKRHHETYNDMGEDYYIHSDISHEALTKFSNHNSPQVRLAIASNHSTSYKILEKLFDDSDKKVCQAAVVNQNNNSISLKKAITHDNLLVRMGAARNPKMTKELLSELLKDKDIDVIKCLAFNASLTEDLLRKLLSNHDSQVRINAVKNVSMTPKLLELALQDNDQKVKENVRHNKNFNGVQT